MARLRPHRHILPLEIVKILINCFVTMKISFANFIGEISNSVINTDSSKIAKAIGMDTRIGNKYLRPGLGFSGPCFPRDNRALQHYSKKVGMDFPYAEVNDKFNQNHITFLTDYFLKQNKNNK